MTPSKCSAVQTGSFERFARYAYESGLQRPDQEPATGSGSPVVYPIYRRYRPSSSPAHHDRQTFHLDFGCSFAFPFPLSTVREVWRSSTSLCRLPLGSLTAFSGLTLQRNDLVE